MPLSRINRILQMANKLYSKSPTEQLVVGDTDDETLKNDALNQDFNIINNQDEDNNNNIIITGSLSQMEAFGALEYCGQIHSSFKSAKCNILLVPDNETVQTPFVPTIHETNVFQDMEYSDTSSESEYSDENVSESPVAHQEGNNSQFEADPAEETFEPRLANRDDNTDNESEADSPDELFKPPATVEEDSNDSEEVGDNEFDASEEDNILKATKGTKRMPINKNKLKDLRNLCDKLVIQKPYQVEYLTLSSHGTNVPDDVLPETDVEDGE
ncbi:hypothetical protein HUJ04_008292 [Dendroctonus ponderosae]|nr:hypothetical protein HUJ04_008292 [Dendroctonus ponderosae]